MNDNDENNMRDYKEDTYGDHIAEVYDQWYSGHDPASIDFLAGLSRGGKALELGIGTGRVAIPLLERGISVHGLDASQSMLEKLKAKPGGDQIQVSLGNFADMAIDGQFDLIYVVFNTIYSLLTQAEQLRCFQNAAQHLAPGGVFVLESFVPDLSRFTAGQSMRVGEIGSSEVKVDVSELELDKQLITAQHVVFTEKGVRFYPVKIRYIWPSEMDLMAQLAGMRLRERWDDWLKVPFSSQSGKHISVYELNR